MVAEALILTALKEPVKKLTNWIFDEASVKISEAKMQNALSKLNEKISDVVMVKTFYQINESIDLHDFYVPTRVKGISNIIDNVSKIYSSSIVLEGTVGQGKSIFMRYLTYQEAIHGDRIPIFFELRRLNEKQTLEDAISTLISNWIPLFKKENFVKIASSGDVVLFLDGFDEIPQEDVNRIINEIEGWRERYSDMQIVISTRPESDIQKSIPFKVYKLAEYEFYEQKNLIKKLVLDKEFQDNLIKNIESSSTEIKELLKTPLMVTLFVKQYEVNLKIPKNQSEFYENLFSNIVSLHDNTKAGFIRNINSKLDIAKLQDVFEEFCFLTGNIQKLVLSRKESIDIIKRCKENQSINASSDDILKDFSTVVCFLLKDGSEYLFIHRSIQEYFYSSFISNKSSTAKEKFYEKLMDIDFYVKIRGIVGFLEKIDAYYYNKYFKLILLEEYIKDFSISKDVNSFMENLYIRGSTENDINLLVFNKNITESNYYFLPYFFPRLLHGFYKAMKDKFNYDGTIGFGLRSDIVDIGNDYIRIKEFSNDEVVKLIDNELLLLSRNIIEERDDILESIEIKDSINFYF